MEKYNRILSFFLFFALAAVITYPLAKPGYILTLDAVITPKVAYAPLTSSSFIYQNILAVMNFFLPSYWIERIILFLIFSLSGWGMYRLVPKKYGIAGYFGGLFYAVNPFVYERVMAGHWQFLLGYSIFPFVTASALALFRDTGKKNSFILAIFTTLLFSTAIHYSLIFLTFFVTMAAMNLYSSRQNKDRLKAIAGNIGFFAVIVFILNANWILSSIMGVSDIVKSISQFTVYDLLSFQSVADAHLGLVFNLLSGYGFWVEVYHYFILPRDIIFFWPVLSAAIILISAVGFFAILKDRKKTEIPLAVTLLVVFLLALDISAGVSLNSVNQLYFFLYNKFSILRSLREPQKLVGILIFCYAYFGSIGFASLLDKAKKSSIFYILCFLFLVLPFIYTPTVFGGFWGQLRPVYYPASWKEVNRVLNNDKDNFLTLVFPWHQYITLSFNRNMASSNPAPYFFDKPVLSSRNYETAYLNSHDTRPEALHVEGLMSIQKKGVNLLGQQVYEKLPWGESLAPINVKYILLLKEEDWKSYRFLDKSADLKKLYDSQEIILYQNLAWRKDA